MANNNVRVWEGADRSPYMTNRRAAPEKSPLFLENRAYQGSTGKSLSMPVTEKISDEKRM